MLDYVKPVINDYLKIAVDVIDKVEIVSDHYQDRIMNTFEIEIADLYQLIYNYPIGVLEVKMLLRELANFLPPVFHLVGNPSKLYTVFDVHPIGNIKNDNGHPIAELDTLYELYDMTYELENGYGCTKKLFISNLYENFALASVEDHCKVTKLLCENC